MHRHRVGGGARQRLGGGALRRQRLGGSWVGVSSQGLGCRDRVARHWDFGSCGLRSADAEGPDDTGPWAELVV